MSAIHETAYPRLKPNLTDNELTQNFTPTGKEYALMIRSTKRRLPLTRIGFIVMLKCYQCLGRPVMTQTIPLAIKTHITSILKINMTTDLKDYDVSKTRQRHLDIIRTYLKINKDKQARRQCMKKAARQAAAIKERLADIINDVIEELIKSYFELPSFHLLVRLARSSRKVINHQYYNQVTQSLSEANKQFIEQLFDKRKTNEKNIRSYWSILKQESRQPSYRQVKSFTQHIEDLKKIHAQITLDIDFIPAHRLNQFIDEAVSLDLSDMRQLKKEKRYCLTVVLIRFKMSRVLDDATTILIRWIQKLHTNAKQALDDCVT